MDTLLSRAQHNAEMSQIPFDQILTDRLRTYHQSAAAKDAVAPSPATSVRRSRP